MTSSFNRWKSTQSYSWPFRVFKKYYEELNLMYWSSIGAHNYIYPSMHDDNLTWETDPTDILSIPKEKYNFNTLRKWSDGYNLTQVWGRLNLIVSLNAIFETYLSTITALSIESDPGVLIHARNSIDGIKFLKSKGFPRDLYDSYIRAITNGPWSARLAALSNLFNYDFPILSTHLKTLEELRKKRNSVGHAYGRDISKSRQFLVLEKQSIDGVSDKTLLRFFDAVFRVAKEIDNYLLQNHIGEYQIILAYHEYLKTNNPKGGIKERAYTFRTFYGKKYSNKITRAFCIDLISLYDLQ